MTRLPLAKASWAFGCALFAMLGAAVGQGSPIFEDRSEAVGLDFVHFNGMSGEYFFPEIIGAGGALLDYDNDGDLDLYLVQGGFLEGSGDPGSTHRPPPRQSGDRLFRNDLNIADDGSLTLRFVDVTVEAGIESLGYGMGAATGDYDNDGWTDIYVTNYGRNVLWHNQGVGPDGRVTFADATEASQTGDEGWGVPALFADFDGDGWLDLFVGNYLGADIDNHRLCHAGNTARTYCSPSLFPAQKDLLYLGRSNGKFRSAHHRLPDFGPSLGAATADFDGNGSSDLYVANDGTPNFLWLNDGHARFVDEALLNGTALSGDGLAEAGMGVATADFDGDGDPDIFVTHLDRETNTLYVNDGSAMFHDRTATARLAAPSQRMTGFGASWLDFDNDGDLDLLVVNGEVDSIEELRRQGDDFPFGQTNQLFRREPDGRYTDVSELAGPAFALVEVSRGAIFGDVDNDGDTDVVVTNNSGPARLLINQVGARNAWLGVRLTTAEGRDALGARAGLFRAGAEPLWRQAHSAGSYASASDPRIVFGLGEHPIVDRLVVQWPSGRTEVWRQLAVARYTTLREGDGEEVE